MSISRYLKVSQGQGISRYLKARNSPKGAGELEIEYLKVSQGISRLGTAQKELGSWKLSISRYLKVSQGKGAGELEIEYLKVSQGISRLGTAQKELGSWKLSISRCLKVSQGSERLKRS